MTYEHTEDFMLNRITPEAFDIVMCISALMGRDPDMKAMRPEGLSVLWEVETAKEYRKHDGIDDTMPAIWIDQCGHGHTTVRVVTDWVETDSRIHQKLQRIGGMVMERHGHWNVTVEYGYGIIDPEDDTAMEAHHVH